MGRGNRGSAPGEIASLGVGRCKEEGGPKKGRDRGTFGKSPNVVDFVEQTGLDFGKKVTTHERPHRPSKMIFGGDEQRRITTAIWGSTANRPNGLWE